MMELVLFVVFSVCPPVLGDLFVHPVCTPFTYVTSIGMVPQRPQVNKSWNVCPHGPHCHDSHLSLHFLLDEDLFLTPQRSYVTFLS